jgi:hypothetical protein
MHWRLNGGQIAVGPLSIFVKEGALDVVKIEGNK